MVWSGISAWALWSARLAGPVEDVVHRAPGRVRSKRSVTEPDDHLRAFGPGPPRLVSALPVVQLDRLIQERRRQAVPGPGQQHALQGLAGPQPVAGLVARGGQHREP